jgi:acetylornithine deacetylase/succinyl-diaminopimelate desuccinylase-like protein
VPEPRAFVAADAERLIEEWGHIALVPAPFGAEAERAALVAHLARAAGADHVEIDRAGNVVTWMDGDRTDGETITYLATMDDLESVASHRRTSSVLLRDGDRLVGPCTETTSSDASALALLRFMRSTNPRPWHRVWVVFVLGEETGLTGVRSLVEDRGSDLGSVVDLMGGIGTVSWNAIGFAGLEVEFRTAPRHSLYGGISEVSDAIGRFVAALHESVPVVSDDVVTVRRVNRIQAGTVFNHSPATGVVGVDIRSTDPDVLAAVEQNTRVAAKQAAAVAGVDLHFEDDQRQQAVALPGGAGPRLVQALTASVEYAGHDPVLRPYSSSNINVVYAAGLPGVVHDATFRGGGRGTADEWTDIPGVIAGVVADCRMLQLLTD